MPKEFDRHWDRGWELYEENKFAEAITEWREASRLDPEDGYPLHLIAMTLSKMDQQEAAIAEWREAVRLEPDHENANASLADALHETGQKHEGLQVLRTALKVSPDSAILLSCLGYYLAKQGDVKNNKVVWLEAREAAQKAVRLEPQNAYALHLLGTMEWRLGQRRKAIELLKASIAADPSDGPVYLTLIDYQSRAFHWRGMAHTIKAKDTLPDFEERDRYYARLNLAERRIKLWGSIIAAALVVLVWARRRKAHP